MRILIIVALMALTGCSSALGTAIRVANSADIFAGEARAEIDRLEKAGYAVCKGLDTTKDKKKACGKTVRAHYDKAWKAYRALRKTWFTYKALLQVAGLTQSDPSPGELAVAGGKLTQATIEMKEAMEGLSP